MHLVVADGFGSELIEDVSIHDLGKPASRLSRVLLTSWKLIAKAVRLNADIIHIHDPELLLAANWFQFRGARVIFDSHEDVPAQLLVKPYLGLRARKILSFLSRALEKILVCRLTGVISATPHINDKFIALGVKSVVISNFPLLSEFPSTTDWSKREKSIVYIGGIEEIRGIREMLGAISYSIEAEYLHLCGDFSDQSLRQKISDHPGWVKVIDYGFSDRTTVVNILDKVMVGLVTLHPTENYKFSLPVKMFEYMAAGIPVIASDFRLWREIIEECRCGLLVNPRDEREIASAIDYLLSNPAVARRLGEAGRQAVLKTYNWDSENRKLEKYYASLVSG